MSLIHGDVAVCFEQHHGYWSPRLHVANNVLSEDVQSEMDISCGIDDSYWDSPDKGNKEPDYKRPPRKMCWPGAYSCETHGYHDNKECTIPPPGYRFVFAHHLSVVVIKCSSDRTSLNPDFLAMEEYCMEDDRSDSSEGETICQRERG